MALAGDLGWWLRGGVHHLRRDLLGVAMTDDPFTTAAHRCHGSCGECNDLRAHLVETHGCNGPYLAQQPRPMLDGIHSGAHSCQRDGQCVLPLDHEGDCDWGDDDDE